MPTQNPSPCPRPCSGCPGPPNSLPSRLWTGSRACWGLFPGLSSWEVCQCSRWLRRSCLCGRVKWSLEVWGECPCACVKVSPVTWDKPKGKRRGQTTDGRLEIKSLHATVLWGHCDTCANPEVLDCKPSLGNPWLTEPRTKDRYSPLLFPQRDNSDLYSTGLFAEPLEGSNQLPIVVISLIIYTWGGFPFFPCFVFQDSYFSSLEPLSPKSCLPVCPYPKFCGFLWWEEGIPSTQRMFFII